MEIPGCLLAPVEHGAISSWKDVVYPLQQLETKVICPYGHILVLFFDEKQTAEIVSSEAHSRLSKQFKIPLAFWSLTCRNANGFFSESLSNDPTASPYTTTSRFLIKRPRKGVPGKDNYVWDKLAIASCRLEDNTYIMLCFDINERQKSRLQRSLITDDGITLKTGLQALNAWFVEQVVKGLDDGMWGWRDVVRQFESTRLDEHGNYRHDFVLMHEIARHTIHCSEMIKASSAVVVRMIAECRRYGQVRLEEDTSAALAKLTFQLSLLEGFLFLSQGLEQRLQNEISLASHVNARQDTILAMRIAQLSQKDGQVTKGIGILGLVFLPSTFLSAIFSTSFFHIDSSERWTVSPMFWVFWVIAIPMTMITVAAWNYWPRPSLQDGREEGIDDTHEKEKVVVV